MLNLIEKFTPAASGRHHRRWPDDGGVRRRRRRRDRGVGPAFTPRREVETVIESLVDEVGGRDRRGRASALPPRSSTMDRPPLSRKDSGLATVEFAIVGSLLCLLVFAIISVGIFINAHMQAANDAHVEAARCSACTPTQSPPGHSEQNCHQDLRVVRSPHSFPRPLQSRASYRCGG